MLKDMKFRMFEVGKIKIGELGAERKKKSGDGTFRLPKKLDHFRVVKNQRDAKGDYLRDPIMDELGEKPRELDIMLITDDIELAFPTSYAYYAGKICICRGDGQTATRTLKSGKTEQVECDVECKYRKDKKCKPSGVLNCLLTKANSIGGCYKFRTHGYSSCQAIISSLWFIKQLTGGVVAWIPLKLKLNEKLVEVDKEMKKVYFASIEYQGKAKELIEKAMEVRKEQIDRRIDMQKLEAQAKKMLTYDGETSEDAAEIQEEFYPENSTDEIMKPVSATVSLQDKLDDNLTEPDGSKVDKKKTNASEGTSADRDKRINGILDGLGQHGYNEMDVQMVLGHFIDEATDAELDELAADVAKLDQGIVVERWKM